MPKKQFSWWPQQLLLGWLNLVLVSPIIYIYIGLPLVMRQQGWSGTEIGILQMAGLPAICKFLLAAPLDRYQLGRYNYRNWALLLSLGYALSLFLLAQQTITTGSLPQIFILALLANLLATWADIPINALAIELLPDSERLRAGTIRSAASSLAAIIGGGVMLLVQTRMGWGVPFYLLAISVLSITLLLPLLKQLTPRQSDKLKAGWRDWYDYVNHRERRLWLLVMMFYFPFVGTVWVYLKPLLLDYGFAPDNIAFFIGIVGGLVGALSSILAGQLCRFIGIAGALKLFATFNVVTVGALSLIIASNITGQLLIVIAITIAFAMGASAGLIFGQMMQYTRPNLTALDYGLQSSLFIITRTTIPLLAGLILDHFGYLLMLTTLVSGLMLTLALVYYFCNTLSLSSK